MGFLPNTSSLTESVGSTLTNVYTLKNDDGTLMNLTGKTFEFTIRTDPAQASSVTPLIKVNSGTSTGSGSITVDTVASQVTVTITATAMAALSQTQYSYTLWMDQGLADATAMVAGTLFMLNVAQP